MKLLSILFVILIIYSCRKTTELQTTSALSAGAGAGTNGGGGLGGRPVILYKWYGNTIRDFSDTTGASTEIPFRVAYINSYQIVNSCPSGDEINFYDIISGSFGGPSIPLEVKLNGTSYYATYVSSDPVRPWLNHYQLLHVSVAALGIIDLCLSNTVNVEYPDFALFYGTPLTDTFFVTIANSCDNGSIQCAAFSPGSGQLSFFVPHNICVCSAAYPANYTYRYKITSSSTWNYVTVSNPTYFSPTAITGLSSGVYEIEGQSVCSLTSSGPFVPAVPNTITVP